MVQRRYPAQLDYKPESLVTAVRIDPNFGAKSLHDINLELDEEHIDILKQNAAWGADLLPEPHRTTVRSLLRDYVQARVGIVYAYGQPGTLRLVQRRAEALQELMWSHEKALAESDGHTRIHILFASTLNDVFNLHTKRVVLGAHYRIPGFVWLALLCASGVAIVAVGFQFGIGGGRRILTANLALAMTFALVMLLAFDLDRAGEGLAAVNQQPMIDLYQSMSKQQ